MGKKGFIGRSLIIKNSSKIFDEITANYNTWNFLKNTRMKWCIQKHGVILPLCNKKKDYKLYNGYVNNII